MNAQSPGASEEIVRLDEVGKVFPNGTVAVSGADIVIGASEFVTFLGPSGCGKSTIFRMVAGLADATSGSVRVFGKDPIAARKGNEVAFVFQDPTLLPWSDVAHNVGLPLSLRGDSRASIKREVARVLDLVGLTGHERDLPRQLSGGMRMRVSIARALISKPRLLLMDEPFAALDEITRQKLQDELLAIWRETNTTILFITHNAFEAAYLASRVVVMSSRPGRIVSDLAVDRAGTPSDVEFRTTPAFTNLISRISADLHPERQEAH